jgi:mannose-6-phosphate isomerase-like protein (cupin superfamily)
VTAPDLHDPLTGQSISFVEVAEDTGGKRLTARVRLDPGGYVPLHVHARQDERVEVVSGSVLVEVRGKAQHLGVGEAIAVPRRHRHVVRNDGEGTAEFVLEVRPARHMEQAMRGFFFVLRQVRPLVQRLKR